MQKPGNREGNGQGLGGVGVGGSGGRGGWSLKGRGMDNAS